MDRGHGYMCICAAGAQAHTGVFSAPETATAGFGGSLVSFSSVGRNASPSSASKPPWIEEGGALAHVAVACSATGRPHSVGAGAKALGTACPAPPPALRRLPQARRAPEHSFAYQKGGSEGGGGINGLSLDPPTPEPKKISSREK